MARAKSITRASSPRAIGAVAGWRRFWLSEAFHNVVAQVIHGVGGSI
jgi:hypothetical protein